MEKPVVPGFPIGYFASDRDSDGGFPALWAGAAVFFVK